jgi:hypothetical protein
MKPRSSERPIQSFPVPSVLSHLVDVYFTRINVFLPLLHRPTFELNLKDELHFRDYGFGSVLLLVCANASRYSDDPRIFSQSNAEAAGWMWFNQVTIFNGMRPEASCLYDLQIYTVGNMHLAVCLLLLLMFYLSSCQLAVMFLKSSKIRSACWSILGLGIRFAIDAGAHRRKTYKLGITPVGELWKRAFWYVVIRLLLLSTINNCASSGF